MKTRAAVAFGAGKPLEVVEVDLQGPKAGPATTLKASFPPFWGMKVPVSWWKWVPVSPQ
jgi:hypothetical protein